MMTAALNGNSSVVSLVNISPEKWPPRHRTYFGSLEVRSPAPGEAYAVTPIRSATSIMDLGCIRRYLLPPCAGQAESSTDVGGRSADAGRNTFHCVGVGLQLNEGGVTLRLIERMHVDSLNVLDDL